MSTAIAILLLFNFSMMGLLPMLFFRQDGNFNLPWFLTAIPFFLAFIVIILSWSGLIVAVLPANSLTLITLRWLAIPLSATSIGLLSMTVGVHRIPLALWHQENDETVELVTWGPYARIRHPFYSSFILAFVATLLAWPHWTTVALVIYVSVVLTLTAIREERRLKSSAFGLEYAKYMKYTGRFIPSLRNIPGD